MDLSKFLVALAALGPFLSACGDDGGDDTPGSESSAGTSNSSGGKGGTSSSGGGGGTGAEGEDVTTCEARACDEDATIDFDFTGNWSEAIVFTSNDCEDSIQDLLPPAFTNEEANFEGEIVGGCIRAEHDPSIYTGAIEADLSGARYCGIASVPVDENGTMMQIINHVTWTSIEEHEIKGVSAIYLPLAGCTLHGDYSLKRSAADD